LIFSAVLSAPGVGVYNFFDTIGHFETFALFV